MNMFRYLFLSILLAPTVALAETLTSLGDFNTHGVTMNPKHACAANGRTFLRIEESGRASTPLRASLITANDYPNDVKLLRRFFDSIGSPSFDGLLELGCFALGDSVAIPLRRGVITVNLQDKVTHIDLPAESGYVQQTIAKNGELYLITNKAAILRLQSNGSIDTMSPPSSQVIGYNIISPAPNTLSFATETGWIEINRDTLTKSIRAQFELTPSEYYQLAGGSLFLTHSDSDDLGRHSRVFVGDGTSKNSTEVSGIDPSHVSLFNHLRDNGKMYFQGSESEIWVSDGTPAGTRTFYRNPEGGFGIALLSVFKNSLLTINDSQLLLIDRNGTATTLAQNMSYSGGAPSMIYSGRAYVVDAARIISTDGTVNGTTVIDISEFVDRLENFLALPSQLLLSGDNTTLRINSQSVQGVTYTDALSTASSISQPLGKVGNRILISNVANDGRLEVYNSDGTAAGTSRVFKDEAENKQFSLVEPIGALRNAFIGLLKSDSQGWGLTAKSSLFVFDDLTATTQVLPITPLNEGEESPYLIIDKSGIEIGSALLFFASVADTGYQLWRTDGTTAGTYPIATLGDSNSISSENQRVIDGILYFSTERTFWSPSTDYTPTTEVTYWVSDGTVAGTRQTTPPPLKERLGTPFVDNTKDIPGLYRYDLTGESHLIWENSSYGMDGCSWVRLIKLEDRFFFHHCSGLYRISTDLTTAERLESYDIPWVVEHQGYLYFPSNDLGTFISRVNTNTPRPQRVYQVDANQMSFGPYAISVQNRLFTWFYDATIGLEPFVLSGNTDECPQDPLKVIPELCGCGTPDTDINNNHIIDCQESTFTPTPTPTPTATRTPTPIADLCPNDPKKTAPGECGCGIPDGDANKNGILDCQDLQVSTLSLAAPKFVFNKKKKTLQVNAQSIASAVQYKFAYTVTSKKKKSVKKTTISKTANLIVKGLKTGDSFAVSYSILLPGTPALESPPSPVRKTKVK